jgi:PqqD family protein of HPr-rel-A system
MADATRFRAPPPDALRLHALDELTAIYHRESGATHVVASPAPEILEALSAQALTLAELLAALADRYDLPDADPHALAARVEELRAAGLVRAE